MAQLEIIYAIGAREDADRLFSYIIEVSGYYRTGQAFIDRIIGRCERLRDFPLVGHPRPDILPNLHTIPFESVVIAYLLSAKRVEILRIFHGAQDYETLLGNP